MSCGTEPDAAAGLFRRPHQFANGVEDHFEVGIIFLFGLIQAACQIAIGREHTESEVEEMRRRSLI